MVYRRIALDIRQCVPLGIERQREDDDVISDSLTELLRNGLQHRRRSWTNTRTTRVEELQDDALVAHELAHPRWPDVCLQRDVNQLIDDRFSVTDGCWGCEMPQLRANNGRGVVRAEHQPNPSSPNPRALHCGSEPCSGRHSGGTE